MALYRHDFIICPWCEKESGCRVDHLYGSNSFQEFGPWFCDQCRRALKGKINSPGDVSIWRDEQCRRGSSRSIALLRLDGKDGPVFFVMDHARYRNAEDDGDEANQDHQRYFFEEHSCPTNWLRECVAVIEDGDCDPHGFLEFVRAVDVPEDFDEDDDSNWPRLFPEAFPAENVIDAELTPLGLPKSA